ncbi:FAD-dependent oxidoreductase [Alcaligenaceae bacterium]|nr:FAD-dependent oxidoreductase [Alcaligenaceae bacterium]
MIDHCPTMRTTPASTLASPFRLRNKTVKNRFVVPAMGTGFATADGFVTPALLDYYEARARGGAGIVIVETTTVEFPRGIHASNKLVADTDLAIPGLAELASVIKRHGALAILQLNHAGRMGKTRINGIQPVAPSAIAAPGGQIPKALTQNEIALIVQRFGAAARRAEMAGFDGSEVHAAHGYLLATFASLCSNKREDKYGGTIEGRSLFLREVLQNMRHSTSDEFLLWCRINGREYGNDDALTLSEGQELAKLVAPYIDAISVSVRGYGSQSLVNYPDAPGALLPVAEAIKQVVKVPVIAVGRLSPEVANRAISECRADFIALGRQTIADPDTPNLILSGRTDDVRPCIACFYCADWGAKLDRPIGCQVNAAVGKERIYELIPTAHPRHVVVIGAGPAGLEAARLLGLRGHRVILLEKEPHIGGQLAQAAIPPHKDRLKPLIRYFSAQLQKANVEIRTSVTVDRQYVLDLKPDIILYAGGAKQIVPNIPGVDSHHVTTPIDVLYERVQPGKTAAIIGGGLTGCEVAEHLDQQGVKVTIIHPHDGLAKEAGSSERTRAIAHLSARPVTVLLRTRCVSISPEGAVVREADGTERLIKAETVVLACGVEPDNALYQDLLETGIEAHMIGDCWRPGLIATAVADGARWGHML